MSGVGERSRTLSLGLAGNGCSADFHLGRKKDSFLLKDLKLNFLEKSLPGQFEPATKEDKELDMITFVVEGRPIVVNREAIQGIEVFEAMFSSVMKEGREAMVEVPNYHYSIIRKLLSFIESGEIVLDDTADGLELLRAADQYQILDLKSYCIDYIKQHTSMENIEDVVQLGCLLQIADLSNILELKHQDNKRASFFSIAANNTVDIQNAAIRAVVKDYAFAVKKFCYFMERNWPALVAAFKSILLKTAICNKAGDEKMVRLLLNVGAKPEVEHLFLAINVGESMLSLLLKCSYAAINEFGDNQKMMKPLDWALDSLGSSHLPFNSPNINNNNNGCNTSGFVVIGNSSTGGSSPKRRLSQSRAEMDLRASNDEFGNCTNERDKIDMDNIVSVILMYMTKQEPHSITWRQICKIIDKDLVKSTEIALNSKEWRCGMFKDSSCEERRFGVKACKEFHHTVNYAYARALDSGNEEIIIVLLLNGVVKSHQHYVFRLIEKGFLKALEIWCTSGLDVLHRDKCFRGKGRCSTYHRTPLEYALMNGRMDMAKLLIQTDSSIIKEATLHSMIKLRQKEKQKLKQKPVTPPTPRSSNHSSPNNSVNLSGELSEEELDYVKEALGDRVHKPVLTVMQELLDLGADVNLTFYENGKTPLHLAVQKGDLEGIQFLVENGANVNAVDTTDQTPLHLAILNGSALDEEAKLDIVKYLVENNVDIEAENVAGERALHIAVLQRSVKIVSYLTGKGADVNIPLRGDMTPLHFAAKEGESALLEALMATEGSLNLYKRNKENKICLHYAVQRDDKGMIEGLLKRQPISEFVDIDLLDIASDKGNKQIVSLLVEVSIKTKKHREEIAVWALKRRYYHILRDQLKAGCDPNALVDETTGDTLLHLACRQGRVQVVKGLVQAQADVQRVNKYNWTPLFDAAKGGFVEVVQFLISAGADVEHWDKQGRTPFIVAQSAKVEERTKEYDQILNLLEDAVWKF